ncbi:MAG: XRE family transcriptional regulator [Mesorhizobium sp.]|nr:MAG: XRE family transcriptional regulator [Mesorhizobium sp.]
MSPTVRTMPPCSRTARRLPPDGYFSAPCLETSPVGDIFPLRTVLSLNGHRMSNMHIRGVDDVRHFLREERKRRRLTQSQLADLTATSQKWVSDFERGRVDPPMSIVLKVLVLLGVTIAFSPATISASDPSDAGSEF